MFYIKPTEKRLLKAYREAMARVKQDKSIVVKSSVVGYQLDDSDSNDLKGWCVILDVRAFTEQQHKNSLRRSLVIPSKQIGKTRKKLNLGKQNGTI